MDCNITKWHVAQKRVGEKENRETVECCGNNTLETHNINGLQHTNDVLSEREKNFESQYYEPQGVSCPRQQPPINNCSSDNPTTDKTWRNVLEQAPMWFHVRNRERKKVAKLKTVLHSSLVSSANCRTPSQDTLSSFAQSPHITCQPFLNNVDTVLSNALTIGFGQKNVHETNTLSTDMADLSVIHNHEPESQSASEITATSESSSMYNNNVKLMLTNSDEKKFTVYKTESNLYRFLSKQQFCLRNYLHMVYQQCKRHPWVILIVIIFFFAFIFLIIALLIFIILPMIVQEEINKTIFKMMAAKLTNPDEFTFLLNIASKMDRRRSTAVRMPSFDAHILYTPSAQVEEEREQQQQHYPLLNGIRQLSLMNSLNRVKVNESISRLFTESYPKYTPSHFIDRSLADSSSVHYKLLNKWEDYYVRGRQLTDISNSNDTIEPLLELGMITIPDTTIKGKTFETQYSTRFIILNSQLFDTFLKELVTKGHVKWTIYGTPTIQLYGISFKNIIFKKIIELQGLQLVQKYVESNKLKKFNKFEANRTNLISVNNVSIQQQQHLKHQIKKHDINDTPEVLDSLEDKTIEIKHFDMSTSTFNLTNLNVRILFRNTDALLTIDPVGQLSLLVLYNKQPIVQLLSDYYVKIEPGINIIDFHGELFPINQKNIIHKDAITHLFTNMLNKKSILLETFGISSSISLYTPAIQSIHLYTSFNLMKHDAIVKKELETFPLIKHMTLDTIELSDSDTIIKGLQIKGTVTIILGNPFGIEGIVTIPGISLEGSMEFITDDNYLSTQSYELNKSFIKNNEHKKPIGKFKASFEGIESSHPMYTEEDNIPLMDVMGIMPISIHQLKLNINLLLDFSLNEKEFKEFIQLVLKKDYIVLSMINVTGVINVMLPIGHMKLEHIPMDRELQLKGFGKLKNIQTEQFHIDGLYFKQHTDITSSTDEQYQQQQQQEGLKISVTIRLPPNPQIKMYLGTLTINVQHRNQHIAYLTAQNCEIGQEDNLFNFTGYVRLENRKFLSLIRLLSAQEPSLLQATFVPTMYTNPMEGMEDNSPKWIKDAILGFSIEFPLKLHDSTFMQTGNNVLPFTSNVPPILRNRPILNFLRTNGPHLMQLMEGPKLPIRDVEEISSTNQTEENKKLVNNVYELQKENEGFGNGRLMATFLDNLQTATAAILLATGALPPEERHL